MINSIPLLNSSNWICVVFLMIFNLFSIPLKSKSKGILENSDETLNERRTLLLGILFLIMDFLNSIAFFIKVFGSGKKSEIIVLKVLAKK